MTQNVLTERRGAVLEVTLNRPKANAIDMATSRRLGEIFTEFRDAPEPRVAILTAQGEKFFCPGWDLKAAAEGEAADADYGVGGFGGLQELRGLNKPVIAALQYSPDVSPEALESACQAAAQIPGLRSVVPLPLAAGDRIPLEGATTSGPTDVMVVSVLRHFLPAEVRVRASWAALGWKVAQMALIHGADELAGWSVAESVAYSTRVRAAARVETDEVKCGVEEAGKVWAPWLAVEEVAR